MKTKSSMVHVRMDTEMKRKAKLKVPNAETRAAMAEVDEMVNTRAARFASADEMFAEVEEASDR